MVWTETVRCSYSRQGLRYTSDCTDDKWVIIAPLLQLMSKSGHPCEHDPCKLWNTIQYIAVTGCQWAQLPSLSHHGETLCRWRICWHKTGDGRDAIEALTIKSARRAFGTNLCPVHPLPPSGKELGALIASPEA
ncbi:transposase [Pseudochrobactrum sp. HB0163]|uniref:transposase n=1 Tax=Pseudochrobactrum sp. HB0163 TaxID=3450708 RepID=UPI003F6E1204